MKTLYIFDYTEREGENSISGEIDLLREMLALAGHDSMSYSDLQETSVLETSVEGKDADLKHLTDFNPKEILFVCCKKPEKISRRFKEVREIDFPEVLKGLSQLSDMTRRNAEETVAYILDLRNFIDTFVES